MAMKGYSTFSKAPGLEPHHQMYLTRRGWGYYHSAEMQSAYSTHAHSYTHTPTDTYIYIYIYIYMHLIRRTRHAGHCRRCKDELLSDVLLWTSVHERVKVGRPARIYTQKLCADTGCSLVDLPGAMDDREMGGERGVREIRASSAKRWWWW